MKKVVILAAALFGLAGAETAWAQTATQPLTEPQARSLAMQWGCTNVSRLSLGQSGRWFGQCQKGGQTVNVLVDEQGKVSQGAPSHVTAGVARADLMAYGCSNVSTLSRGPRGSWHGRCQKGGETIEVTVDQQGRIVSH
jgi:hypothetical protein